MSQFPVGAVPTLVRNIGVQALDVLSANHDKGEKVLGAAILASSATTDSYKSVLLDSLELERVNLTHGFEEIAALSGSTRAAVSMRNMPLAERYLADLEARLEDFSNHAEDWLEYAELLGEAGLHSALVRLLEKFLPSEGGEELCRAFIDGAMSLCRTESASFAVQLHISLKMDEDDPTPGSLLNATILRGLERAAARLSPGAAMELISVVGSVSRRAALDGISRTAGIRGDVDYLRQVESQLSRSGRLLAFAAAMCSVACEGATPPDELSATYRKLRRDSRTPSNLPQRQMGLLFLADLSAGLPANLGTLRGATLGPPRFWSREAIVGLRSIVSGVTTGALKRIAQGRLDYLETYLESTISSDLPPGEILLDMVPTVWFLQSSYLVDEVGLANLIRKFGDECRRRRGRLHASWVLGEACLIAEETGCLALADAILKEIRTIATEEGHPETVARLSLSLSLSQRQLFDAQERAECIVGSTLAGWLISHYGGDSESEEVDKFRRDVLKKWHRSWGVIAGMEGFLTKADQSDLSLA
jgi:hypothetical protein